jgi:hypothetical protein
VATSRVKTEGGLGVGITHPDRRLVTVCGCADVTLTADPALQRFVHDYQAESGGTPGPFAIEAYDAARWLLGAADDGRVSLADRVAQAGAVEGLLGTYRIDRGGGLLSGPTSPGSWRASGSRWLPIRRTVALAPASALPLAAVVARVPPWMRPRRRAAVVHGSPRREG